MKIAPIAAPSVAPQTPQAPSTRVLRMHTNATPGLVPASEEELTIPDKGDPAEATVEATQPLSPQFAALAKQRRALQVKEREIADREKALSAQSSTQEGAVDLARLKSDPLSVLLENGVTYDQLTQAILNDQGGGSEVRALQAKIDALEKGVDQKFTDKATQEEKQVLAEMQKEATQLVASGEAFELVRETRSIPQVMTLIERTYRETGEVLGVQEALQLVEDELIGESLKLAALKKVQGRLQPEPPQAPSPQPRQMRTLTNRDTSAVPLTPKQRALLAFTGQLKK